MNLDRHSEPPPLPTARSLLSRTLPLDLTRYVSLYTSLQILPRADPSSPTAGESDRPLCLIGSQCYVSTIYITTLATFVAILMSVYAGYRDKLREMNMTTAGQRRVPLKTSGYSEEPEGESSSLGRREDILG